MATLTGNQIKNSYDGLLKTTDNAALPASGRIQITDGLGNGSVLELGQQEAMLYNPILIGGDSAYISANIANDQFVYSGGQDFSAATVTGLPGVQSVVAGTNVTVDNTDPANPIVNASGGGGAAGLVEGTGTDSMQSAAALTATPANAAASKSIALGDGATVNSGATNGIAIGTDRIVAQEGAIGIGRGYSFVTAAAFSVTIGDQAGYGNGNSSISIGNNTTAQTQKGICLNARIESGAAVGAINMNGQNNYNAVAGYVQIGDGSLATATNSVALGAGVEANRANVATVKELELQTVGGGIFMKSPDGTVYKLTVANGGTLTVTAV